MRCCLLTTLMLLFFSALVEVKAEDFEESELSILKVEHVSDTELSMEEESRVSDTQQTAFARQTSHDDTMDESQTEDFSNEGGSVGEEAAGGVEAASQGNDACL